MSQSSSLCLSPHHNAHLQAMQTDAEKAVELPQVRGFGLVGQRKSPERAQLSSRSKPVSGAEAKGEVHHSDEHSGDGALKQLDSCVINRTHPQPSNQDQAQACTLSAECKPYVYPNEQVSPECTKQEDVQEVKGEINRAAATGSSNNQEGDITQQTDNNKLSSNSNSNTSKQYVEPSLAAEMCCATRIPPSQRRIIKRKVSVFSHDGFPNIQLLDQQHVKAHKEEPQQERASGATDLLNSTGSSRASSCDEPTTAVLAAATPNSSATSAASGASVRRKSSAGSITNASSTCSLDSTGWPMATGEEGAQLAASAVGTISDEGQTLLFNNASNTKASAPVAPFKSIKAQLKQNSMPNAQTIQRHIDNLISQNEQIVDNWNLISIRSYTSSRQEAAGQLSKRLDEHFDDANICPIEKQSSNLNTSPAKPVVAATNISKQQNKRWSTAMMTNLQSNFSSNELAPSLSLITATGDGSSSKACDTTDNSLLSMATNIRLKQHERKRSYNLSKRPSVNSLIESMNQTKPLPPSMPSSPAIVDAQKFVDTQLEQRKLSDAYRLSLQEPAQLENAIQNLSLKRKEDVSGPITMDYNMDLLQQDLMLTRFQRDEQLAMALLAEQRTRLSLLAKQQEQQQQLESNLEKQSAILRQQQVIEHEQQLEQLRLNQLVANIEMQQQRHSDQHERVRSLPTFFTSIHQQDMHLGVNYLREQQALESQLLKDFLSRLTANQHHHEQQPQQLQQQINMEHGGEMFTQSLDSAMPLYRCETCDISFWTRDLLNYHHMTQCLGRSSTISERPPVSFSFGARLNQFEQNSSQSEFSKPEIKSERREGSEIVGTDRDLINGESIVAADISILKQQLLTSATNVPLGSLPFKKRKISEPTM